MLICHVNEMFIQILRKTSKLGSIHTGLPSSDLASLVKTCCNKICFRILLDPHQGLHKHQMASIAENRIELVDVKNKQQDESWEVGLRITGECNILGHKYCTWLLSTSMQRGLDGEHRLEHQSVFTHKKVQHDLLACSAVTLVHTVDGPGQPGDAMPRYLYQLHQGAHAAPGRVLAGAHPQPLGEPQVDGEQRAEGDVQEGRVQLNAVLL